jgi:hypothetical protein
MDQLMAGTACGVPAKIQDFFFREILNPGDQVISSQVYVAVQQCQAPDIVDVYQCPLVACVEL